MFKVPQKTSVLKNHIHSPIGTMSFAPKRKYQTYRFADEKYQKIQVGDVVSIKEYGGAIIGPAKITQKVSTTFLDLPLDSPGHETPKDKEHQRKVLSGYYAFLGREIRDPDPFIILDFELI